VHAGVFMFLAGARKRTANAFHTASFFTHDIYDGGGKDENQNDQCNKCTEIHTIPFHSMEDAQDW
jgi:hypothetical protein